MYYSSGNYEAFARPKKPAGVDGKSAYIIGTGLAALSAACYLVRDAQMPGKNIHILESHVIGDPTYRFINRALPGTDLNTALTAKASDNKYWLRMAAETMPADVQAKLLKEYTDTDEE